MGYYNPSHRYAALKPLCVLMRSEGRCRMGLLIVDLPAERMTAKLGAPLARLKAVVWNMIRDGHTNHPMSKRLRQCWTGQPAFSTTYFTQRGDRVGQGGTVPYCALMQLARVQQQTDRRCALLRCAHPRAARTWLRWDAERRCVGCRR